jgi:hypothetical protein
VILGCTTTEIAGGTTAGVVGVTYLAGRAPAHEIQQVYYLGVLDPLEQVPPTVYRVTIRGQSSLTSSVRFGSGWVPAALIDSLNTNIDFDDNGRLKIIRGGSDKELSSLKPDRRFVQFGPEGFREAPKDHRLVVVMGSNPEAFFKAIDRTLGAVAGVSREKADSEVSKKLLVAMGEVLVEKTRLTEIRKDVKRDLPVQN